MQRAARSKANFEAEIRKARFLRVKQVLANNDKKCFDVEQDMVADGVAGTSELEPST